MSSEPRPAFNPDGSRMTLHGIPIMICDDMAPGTIVLTDNPGAGFDPGLRQPGTVKMTDVGPIAIAADGFIPYGSFSSERFIFTAAPPSER